jgi:hypothetical protein
VVEQIVWIVVLLDRDQAGKIVAPIGGGIIGQIEIAIVHVSRARQMRPHRRIDFCDLREMGGRVGRAGPAREILDAVLRARAPRKRRGIGGNPRDPAAIGRDSELDQAVQLVPKIYDVMRQAPSDPASTEPFQELLDVIKTAIG